MWDSSAGPSDTGSLRTTHWDMSIVHIGPKARDLDS